MAVYNKLVEQPLGGTEEFALLGGFLSYKVRMLCTHAPFLPHVPCCASGDADLVVPQRLGSILVVQVRQYPNG